MTSLNISCLILIFTLGISAPDPLHAMPEGGAQKPMVGEAEDHVTSQPVPLEKCHSLTSLPTAVCVMETGDRKLVLAWSKSWMK